MTVRRRFKDVVALSQVLQQTVGGPRGGGGGGGWERLVLDTLKPANPAFGQHAHTCVGRSELLRARPRDLPPCKPCPPSQALSDALPGYFLPQRPHRNQLKTRLASKEFLEDRRAGLERYLRRLCAHPVASSSQVGVQGLGWGQGQ